MTDKQKAVASCLGEKVRNGNLEETFFLIWGSGICKGRDPVLIRGDGQWELSPIDSGTLDAMQADGLIRTAADDGYPFPKGFSGIAPPYRSVRCTITQKLMEAIESNFAAPDTSFVRHLTPLADVLHLDLELKQRCLPILGAGAADPKLWDSAVRTAGVILEERLRSIGLITDVQVIGRELVNRVFGRSGTLAMKLTHDAERESYRDLYAGVVGAFRNPSAHRLIDPTPHEGGAFIVFVNLLLAHLDKLGESSNKRTDDS